MQGEWKNAAGTGTLTAKEEGLLTIFTASCPAPGPGVYRLYVTSGGREVSLGVMLPEGERLTFQRKFTKNGLAAIGVEEITAWEARDQSIPIPAPTESSAGAAPAPKPPPAEDDPTSAELAALDWVPCQDVCGVFADEDLQETCKNVKNALVCQKDPDTLYLAIPADGNAPFPMMPIFCFGQGVHIHGRYHIVFKLKDGQLIA